MKLEGSAWLVLDGSSSESCTFGKLGSDQNRLDAKDFPSSGCKCAVHQHLSPSLSGVEGVDMGPATTNGRDPGILSGSHVAHGHDRCEQDTKRRHRSAGFEMGSSSTSLSLSFRHLHAVSRRVQKVSGEAGDPSGNAVHGSTFGPKHRQSD